MPCCLLAEQPRPWGAVSEPGISLFFLTWSLPCFLRVAKVLLGQTRLLLSMDPLWLLPCPSLVCLDVVPGLIGVGVFLLLS